MPAITGRWKKDVVNGALTCNPANKPSHVKALMLELYEVLRDGLVKHVGESASDIVFESTPFSALTDNRFPIEFEIRCTRTKEWGDKDDTAEIIGKLIKRMVRVLKRWRDEGKLAFHDWQTSIELTFIDKFAASEPI